MTIQTRVSIQMRDPTTGADITTGVSGRIRFGTGGWADRVLTHTEHGVWHADLTGGEAANESCDLKGTHASGLTEMRTYRNVPTAGEIAAAIGPVDLNADQSGVTIGTVNTLAGHTPQTGDSYAALTTPTGEPGQGVPPTSLSPLERLRYLYKSWLNRKDNNSTQTNLYNSAGTVVDQKQSTSFVGGTTTKGSWESGP